MVSETKSPAQLKSRRIYKVPKANLALAETAPLHSRPSVFYIDAMFRAS